MGIVIITTAEDSKRSFVNTLHRKSGENVNLVIIQEPFKLSIFRRFKRLYKDFGPQTLLKEIFYSILLRLDSRKRNALEYFRERNETVSEKKYLPKTLKVFSVNSPEISNILQYNKKFRMKRNFLFTSP